MSDLIGIPFLSAFLFVMGGILVGHLLWYRDRRHDLATVQDAETKYSKAKAVARARKQQYTALRSDLQSYESQRDDWQRERAKLEGAIAAQKQQTAGVQATLDRFQADKSRFELSAQDANAEVARLKSLLEQSDERLEKASGSLRQLADAADQAGDEFAKRQAVTDQLREEIESLQSHSESLEQSLQDATAQLADLTQQRNVTLSQRDQFATEREESLARQTSLEKSLAELMQKFSDLRIAHDKLQKGGGVSLETIEDLQEQLQRAQLRIDALTDEHEELLQQLDERTGRIQAAIDGRVAAETALSDTQQELDILRASIIEVTNERDQQHKTLREIHGSTDELRRQIKEQSTRLATKEQELEKLNAFRPEFEKLRETVAKRNGDLTQLNEQLQIITHRENELRQQYIALQSESKQWRTQNEQSQSRIAEQTTLIGRLRSELASAIQGLESLRPIATQAPLLRQNVQDLSSELKRMSTELNASLDANAQIQDRVRQLENQLHQNAALMRDLRRKRANIPSLASDTHASPPQTLPLLPPQISGTIPQRKAA